jgi:DNA-directed RNA polymerase-5 subunit 1
MLFSCELFLGYLFHILSKDAYIGPKVVELPPEVAKRITFEEQVTGININRMQ